MIARLTDSEHVRPFLQVRCEVILEGCVAVRVVAEEVVVQVHVAVHVDAVEADGDALVRHEVRGRVSEVLAVLQRSGASGVKTQPGEKGRLQAVVFTHAAPSTE